MKAILNACFKLIILWMATAILLLITLNILNSHILWLFLNSATPIFDRLKDFLGYYYHLFLDNSLLLTTVFLLVSAFWYFSSQPVAQVKAFMSHFLVVLVANALVISLVVFFSPSFENRASTGLILQYDNPTMKKLLIDMVNHHSVRKGPELTLWNRKFDGHQANVLKEQSAILGADNNTKLVLYNAFDASDERINKLIILNNLEKSSSTVLPYEFVYASKAKLNLMDSSNGIGYYLKSTNDVKQKSSLLYDYGFYNLYLNISENITNSSCNFFNDYFNFTNHIGDKDKNKLINQFDFILQLLVFLLFFVGLSNIILIRRSPVLNYLISIALIPGLFFAATAYYKYIYELSDVIPVVEQFAQINILFSLTLLVVPLLLGSLLLIFGHNLHKKQLDIKG